ncbi:conserved hypothetical protein [metagenome]|uniref:Uncharacterized protein n=1 Tax=metagenome TaxID=256318 RepID=A0A2P2C009_9ZZZZ
MLPRFEVLDRLRPVDLLAPGLIRTDLSWRDHAPASAWSSGPAVAPYLAVVLEIDEGEVDGRLSFGWAGADGSRLLGWYDGRRRLLGIDLVSASGVASSHRSRRFGRLDGGSATGSLALTLTGTHLSVLTAHRGIWSARARVDLAGTLDARSETFLHGLEVGFDWDAAQDAPSPVRRLRAGSFGQLGLRDLHVATQADGEIVRRDGRIVLTATHAGPGFFDTGHTGVWTFDPETVELEHVADLYFHRPDRAGVFGDHATHLVRDGDQWLVATSTWGDFDRTSVSITLARTGADLLHGQHVLDTVALRVPSTGVGVWDPHLARIDDVWHVAYVSARKFFAFHPALCRGTSLDDLHLVAEDRTRRATEGTVLVQLDGEWCLLASDGRDNASGRRERYPVYDLRLREIGALDAPYSTNIPWPMVVPHGDVWLMLTFDGTRYGGGILGYGTHGDVVVMRTGAPGPQPG